LSADDAVVTLRVERRDSVAGAAGVVVLGGDGRVVGYQLRPDPAEALSDLVDVEDYEMDDEAFEYLPEGATFGPEAIPALLEQDVPVYAVGP
jgi:mannose-1-phosphate guanylyltransferase/mannose-1-phosphate guanylyltransferase/phosphomannomutase